MVLKAFDLDPENDPKPKNFDFTPEERKHQHKWVHLETTYARPRESGNRVYCYKRVDRFFCETCLEQDEVKREEHLDSRPDWYPE